jgi:DNA polymerase III subunit chi
VSEAGLVRFYACEGDPLRVALKLTLKARQQAQAVQVCGEPAQLQRLSALLWNESGFVAHAGPQAVAAVRSRSHILLETSAPATSPPVLINLSDGLDLSALAVQRLFEIVGPDEAQRQGGRERFRRHAQQRGARPEHVQVAA